MEKVIAWIAVVGTLLFCAGVVGVIFSSLAMVRYLKLAPTDWEKERCEVWFWWVKFYWWFSVGVMFVLSLLPVPDFESIGL